MFWLESIVFLVIYCVLTAVTKRFPHHPAKAKIAIVFIGCCFAIDITDITAEATVHGVVDIEVLLVSIELIFYSKFVLLLIIIITHFHLNLKL